VLDFHRELIHDLMSRIPFFHTVTLFAFIQAALETQIPPAGEAFDEQREFFRSIYPTILHQNRLEHPEDNPEGVTILIPTPSKRGEVVKEFKDAEPRIILPSGSRLIQ
jgi:hypothetical protein